MENQLKVSASDQPILEEEEIILLLLQRWVLRQMSSFLPLAKSWCWAVMTAVTLGGSHTPGKFCDCCRAQKDAAVSLSPPSILTTFHAGAVLTSELLVARAQLLCCETGPDIGRLRDLLKAQTLPAFTWEPSWCRGWRVTCFALFTSIECFWRIGLATGFSDGFAFIYNYWHTAAIAHHPQQMHSEAHRRLSLEMDRKNTEIWEGTTERKTNHRAKVLFISKLAVPQLGN